MALAAVVGFLDRVAHHHAHLAAEPEVDLGVGISQARSPRNQRRSTFSLVQASKTASAGAS